MAIAQTNAFMNDADERTKPSFLRRVRIRNYKSIAFCDVALQPLTILVGRNASGKSNFLDALAFLRDVLEKGIAEAVRLHGGRKAILPRSARGAIISISLEAGYKGDTQAACLENYSIELKLPAQSKPVVATEQARIRTNAGSSPIGFDRKNEHVKWVGFPDVKSSPQIDWCDSDYLMLSMYGKRPFGELHDRISLAGIYNFSPDAMRELQKPSLARSLLLERNGCNLAGVIERVRKFDEDTFHRIEAYLSAIVTEVERIKVVHYGEYETVRFQLHSDTRSKPLEFDASSMSDGTLRALASLVAAFQFHHFHVPSLVGIEEPEISLHPAALRALMDALSEATERTQILLTTHSADLLADRELHPSQVLVVRNRDGQTRITPVDSASREIIEKELSTLADLQRQDYLDLDEADLQRQAAEQTGKRGA